MLIESEFHKGMFKKGNWNIASNKDSDVVFEWRLSLDHDKATAATPDPFTDLCLMCWSNCYFVFYQKQKSA